MVQNWFHIRTEENPADLVSRGLSAKEIVQNSLWWQGPKWLLNPEDSWPKPIQIEQLKRLPEMVVELKVHNVSEQSMNCKLCIQIPNYKRVQLVEFTNNLIKLIRILCYVQKFVNNCKFKNPAMPTKAIDAKGALKRLKLPTEAEKLCALKNLIKQEQSTAFRKEIKYLEAQTRNQHEPVHR